MNPAVAGAGGVTAGGRRVVSGAGFVGVVLEAVELAVVLSATLSDGKVTG